MNVESSEDATRKYLKSLIKERESSRFSKCANAIASEVTLSKLEDAARSGEKELRVHVHACDGLKDIANFAKRFNDQRNKSANPLPIEFDAVNAIVTVPIIIPNEEPEEPKPIAKPPSRTSRSAHGAKVF